MRLAVLLICFLLPLTTRAAVTISEIAWMGDTTSPNYEWIELRNDGEAATIDGWVLSDGGNLTITLAGTIPANSFVILERNRSTGEYLVVPPFLAYTGALVNTGATLTLRRTDGTLVDQVAGGENWGSIGGNNATKETPQLTSNGWRTAAPTPGRANTTTGSAPGPIITNPPPTATTSTTTETNPSPTLGGGTSGTQNSKKSSGEAVKLVLPDNELRLTPEIQTVAYVGQPVTMRVEASGLGKSFLDSLVYRWNFGDMATGSGKKVTHRYTRPGTYVITIDARFARYEQRGRHTITVLPVTLSLDRNADGDILLHNNAPYDIDVSGFVVSGVTRTKFPPYSVMAAKSTLIVPMATISATPYTPVYVSDTKGQTITVWPQREPATTSTAVMRPTAQVLGATISLDNTVNDNAVVETTASVSGNAPAFPLILRPISAGGLALDDSPMPAYVLAALSNPTLKEPSTDPVSPAFTWPYYIFGAVLLAAVGGLLATAPKPVSSTNKMTLFTAPGDQR